MQVSVPVYKNSDIIVMLAELNELTEKMSLVKGIEKFQAVQRYKFLAELYNTKVEFEALDLKFTG